MEFKPFGKILHIGKLYMSITQKIHGTNAQILIDGNFIKAGSRTRWLTIDDDNYGFARWVCDNTEELVAKLGDGRHFGEWAGPGINSGEGLAEKTLVLFNWRRWVDKGLPNRVTTVPVLYKGAISLDAINENMEWLKVNGSALVPGYMKPEGIVVELDGQFYKNVFDAEEVKWKEGSTSVRSNGTLNLVDVSHLLQPLRLEKLLSRDERYLLEYPESLRKICSDYVLDLEQENQFIAKDADGLKVEKKALGKQVYYFVKTIVAALKQ